MHKISNVLAEDFKQVFYRVGGLWENMRKARIFVTGGTGFFGAWLLYTLLEAQRQVDLEIEAVLLTRNPSLFSQKHPLIARASMVRLYQGDIANFTYPAGKFTHMIHAASELSHFEPSTPSETVSHTERSCLRMMDFAKKSGVTSVLYISSGAVYGPMQPGRRFLSEDQSTLPMPHQPENWYAKAKRAGEKIMLEQGNTKNISVKIARGFAFHGPMLPLDSPFAVAAFLGRALSNEKIVIRNHGLTVRSYLYGADLAQWLWTILIRGAHGRAYNTGSDIPVTILHLAEAIQKACQTKAGLQVLGTLPPGQEPEFYVPKIQRAKTELSLEVFTGLEEGLARSVNHYREVVQVKTS